MTQNYLLDRASGLLDAQLLSSATNGTFTFTVPQANPVGTQSWNMPAGYTAILTIGSEQILISAMSISGMTVTATISTRGYNSTTAATQAAGSTVQLTANSGWLQNIQGAVANDDASILSALIYQSTVTTVVSATSHTIAGDQTAIFTVGREYVFKVAGTWYRGIITVVSFGAGTTTITLLGDGLPGSGTVTQCGFEFSQSIYKAVDVDLIKSMTTAPASNPPAGYVWMWTKSGNFFIRDSSGNVRMLGKVTASVSSSGGVLTIDLTTANFFECTLTENITSVSISGGADGEPYSIRFKQAAGAYTVVLGSSFRFNVTIPGYTATGTNGAFDYIDFTYNSDSGKYEIRSITVGTQASVTNANNSQTLTDGANIAWGLASGTLADVTLGGGRTLSNPTGMTKQLMARLIAYQDATGGRTLAFGTAFQFSGAAPSMSTGKYLADIMDFACDGTNMYMMNIKQAFGGFFGYFAGGITGAGSTTTSVTNGLDFNSDTTTQVTKGALTAALAYKVGHNSATVGYFAGGSTNNNFAGIVATTDGLAFATDTTAAVTKGALATASVAGASAQSATVGYYAGGQSGTASTSILSTTEGLTYATDTTTQVTKGAMSTARTETGGGTNSGTLGYFSGGLTGNFVNVVTTDSLTFATDTTTMVTKGAILTATYRLGTCNSSTVAYFAGGNTGANVTICYGLAFASDTSSMVTKGAMTAACSDRAGVNSGTIGYFAGGNTNGASQLTVTDGLTFASDTVAMVTKGALSTGSWGMAGVQGSKLGNAQIV